LVPFGEVSIKIDDLDASTAGSFGVNL